MVTCCAGCKGTACPTKDGTVQWESGSERTNGVDHFVLLSSVGADRENGTGPIQTLHYAEEKLGKLAPLTAVRAAYFRENAVAMSVVGMWPTSRCRPRFRRPLRRASTG